MWVVVLRRANGRFVKQLTKPIHSKYATKHLAREWEKKYDHTYRIAVERI